LLYAEYISSESDLDLQIEDEPNEKIDATNELDQEHSLLLVLQKFLAFHGMAFSQGALRDLCDGSEVQFNEKSALQVLTALGFDASFGRLKVKRIKGHHCPLIGFKKDGSAVLVEEIEPNGSALVKSFNENELSKSIPKNVLSEQIQNHFIIASRPGVETNGGLRNNWFWGSFSQSKWLYFQVIIAAALTNFLGLSTSVFIMVVYDRVVPNEAIESLIALTAGVCIALIFDFIIKTLRAHFVDRAGKRADLRMSRLIFDRLLSSQVDGRSQRTGAMAAVVREFDTLREFFTSATLIAIVDLPFVFFFIYVIYLIAGPLAYVPLIAVPLVIIVGLGIQPFLARITRGSVESGMNKQAVLVETLNGIETINATGSGKLMKKRYEDALSDQSESGNRIRALSNLIVNFAASIQQYAQVAAIFFGVYLIVDGTITQGALIGAVILGGRTMSPLSQLANTLSRLNGALTAYRNLSKLIGKSHNSFANLSPISRASLSGEIEFKNVSFRFDEGTQPIIDNLSFKIPAGQKVALVGKMGSGKSTLSRLIAGIYAPTEGAILIDGVDVRQIDTADIKKNIGIMLQESWLFSGTVRENIQMGFSEYDDEHLLRVCKISGVDDFIGSNPKGYELEIRERGQGLSGGQKQALNLARSLLHDPNILLLDEPTSSMDQGSEKKVVASLQETCAEKTMLIVTHRNPILTIVDRVFVLENGKIIADQTPEQLGIKRG